MRDGERFAIHFVGKQRVAVERFLDGQAANEIGCASYSAIRTVEPEVTRCWLDSHGGEKVGQPNPCPSRGADGSSLPLHTRNRWVKKCTAVPGAFQRNDLSGRPHPPYVVQAQFERLLNLAFDTKPPCSHVNRRSIEMRSNIEEVVWCNPGRQEVNRCLEIFRTG
jgi:hypothetical protein